MAALPAGPAAPARSPGRTPWTAPPRGSARPRRRRRLGQTLVEPGDALPVDVGEAAGRAGQAAMAACDTYGPGCVPPGRAGPRPAPARPTHGGSATGPSGPGSGRPAGSARRPGRCGPPSGRRRPRRPSRRCPGWLPRGSGRLPRSSASGATVLMPRGRADLAAPRTLDRAALEPLDALLERLRSRSGRPWRWTGGLGGEQHAGERFGRRPSSASAKPTEPAASRHSEIRRPRRPHPRQDGRYGRG